MAQAQQLVALGAQRQRLRGMVVGDQQVAAALGQAQYRIVHVERDQPRLDIGKATAQRHQPVRKKGEGQRMRDRKLDHVLAAHTLRSHQVAGDLQRAQDVERLGVQRLTSGGQTRGVGRAVNQVDAGPGFQRLDAPRKGRLGDVAQLRRAGEAARLGEADKVL